MSKRTLKALRRGHGCRTNFVGAVFNRANHLSPNASVQSLCNDAPFGYLVQDAPLPRNRESPRHIGASRSLRARGRDTHPHNPVFATVLRRNFVFVLHYCDKAQLIVPIHKFCQQLLHLYQPGHRTFWKRIRLSTAAFCGATNLTQPMVAVGQNPSISHHGQIEPPIVQTFYGRRAISGTVSWAQPVQSAWTYVVSLITMRRL